MACEDIELRLNELRQTKEELEKALELVPPKVQAEILEQLASVNAQIATENNNLEDCIAGVINPQKSACLTVFCFDDNDFKTLVQNAQINLQHYIDGYDKSVLLKKDLNSVGQTKPTLLLEPTMEVFLGQIVSLTEQGYRFDVRTFTHGYHNQIVFNDDQRLSVNTLRRELDVSVTGINTYPIVSVYGCNCYGKDFNETWIALGAKVSTGARYTRFFPNQANKFSEEWKKGDVDFDQALHSSNTSSSRFVMQELIKLDATGKSNFIKCTFPKGVLSNDPCAESYFINNWFSSPDEWQDGMSGEENMEYSSYMFRRGQKNLTWNGVGSLRW